MVTRGLDAEVLKKQSKARIALFLLVIWVIVIILLELGWRTYLYTIGKGFFDNPKEFTSPWFTTYEEPQPYKWKHEAWYRNGKVSFEKAPNEVRIICFGGSTTVNARAGISYPELLEKRLGERYKGYTIRVLNAGSDGYSTAHFLVNLSLRNLDLHPDIITVYENINDLSVKDFGDWPTSDYANKYLSDFFVAFRHRSGFVAEITKVSRLARFIALKIPAIAFPQGYGGGRTAQGRDYHETLEFFNRNLKNIAAIARANGIRLVLVSQPAKAEFRQDEGFRAFNDSIRATAQAEGAVFIDVAAEVTEDEAFLNDQIHNTRRGVEDVAEVMYPSLERLVGQVIAARDGR
jgi:hypothetical protein